MSSWRPIEITVKASILVYDKDHVPQIETDLISGAVKRFLGERWSYGCIESPQVEATFTNA